MNGNNTGILRHNRRMEKNQQIISGPALSSVTGFEPFLLSAAHEYQRDRQKNDNQRLQFYPTNPIASRN